MTDKIDDELRRALLDEAAKVPDDPAFWTDFSRDVRLQVDAVVATRAKRWRYSLIVAGPLLVGAAALVFLSFGRGDSTRTKTDPIAHVDSALDPWPATDVELLEEGELEAVLAELGDLDDDDNDGDTNNNDSASGPYEIVEDIANEDLERVLSALDTGA